MDRRPPGNVKNIFKKASNSKYLCIPVKETLELLHAVTRIYAQIEGNLPVTQSVLEKCKV